METLSQVKTVVFDKTGTITKGNFVVSGVHHSTMEDKKLVELAALAEAHSSHPISRSLQEAYGKPLDLGRVSDVTEYSGEGVVAVVDGKQVAAGNLRLMKRLGITAEDCHKVGTVVHIALDGEYAGHILIADELKGSASEAMKALAKAGVRRTVMLTGDKENVAQAVASEVGISEYHAGLLPADKVGHVEKLLASSTEKDRLAFSDAAIEAADVVLMDDDPLKIAKAIRIAKKCMRIVYENMYFAIGVKLACLLLGALGIANMWLAIFADVGVMVICVLNAIRCLMVKNL